MVEVIDVLGPDPLALLKAMAVCAPTGFRLGLAAEVAGLADPNDALQELVSRALVKEVDPIAQTYVLHPVIRHAAGRDESLALRHAETLQRRFAN